MRNVTNKALYRVILAIGYVMLFASYIYSIFYSMPANDDYAWAIEWWSTNRFVEMFHRIGWNYMNSFGNSGIIAIAVQVLINPLYLFDNAGHSIGIFMIIVNILIMLGILWGARNIFKILFGIESEIVLDTLAFLIAVLITTSYYYSDVYNWWSGTPGYSGMMMMSIITCASILKYYSTDNSNKAYITMIILGVISCTSMMYCVLVGGAYIMIVCFVYHENNETFRKKLLPFICYVITGIIMVIAPGNYTRMNKEHKIDYNMGLLHSITVSAWRVLHRGVTTILYKPWVWAVLLMLLVLGMYVGCKRKVRLINIILSLVLFFASAFSGVLLYVHGSNKTMDSEFTPRIYYVEDYIMFIGVAIAVFAVGCWINQVTSVKIGKKVLFSGNILILLILILSVVPNEKYKNIIQIDMYQRADLIRESWYYWDDILQLIESGNEEDDIVVSQKNVDWSPYSYYVGMDSTQVPMLSEDDKYGNCNQCASKYYGVKSIIVDLY